MEKINTMQIACIKSQYGYINTNMRQNRLEDKKRQKRIFYNDKRVMYLPLRIHTDKKREINNLTIFRNFNTLLIMDKTSKQMNKETEELQNTLNQLVIIQTSIEDLTQQLQNTHSSQAHMKYSQGQTLGQVIEQVVTSLRD